MANVDQISTWTKCKQLLSLKSPGWKQQVYSTIHSKQTLNRYCNQCSLFHNLEGTTSPIYHLSLQFTKFDADIKIILWKKLMKSLTHTQPGTAVALKFNVKSHIWTLFALIVNIWWKKNCLWRLLEIRIFRIGYSSHETLCSSWYGVWNSFSHLPFRNQVQYRGMRAPAPYGHLSQHSFPVPAQQLEYHIQARENS